MDCTYHIAHLAEASTSSSQLVSTADRVAVNHAFKIDRWEEGSKEEDWRFCTAQGGVGRWAEAALPRLPRLGLSAAAAHRSEEGEI
jgi:hypothetical protein